MIFIFHGEDNVTSRKAFSDSKNSNSVTFDAQNLSLVELNQTLQGSGLFGGETQIFIENLFTNKTKSVEQITNLINENSKKADIYLFSDKLIPAKSLKTFENAKMNNFEIPRTIWTFVDGIRPNNPQNVRLFRLTLETNEPEYVFSMILRQFRLLLGLDSQIDEVKRLAPWQMGKLSRQKSFFGENKLKNIYHKLYKIDRQTKTGATSLTLTQSIDMLLLEL